MRARATTASRTKRRIEPAYSYGLPLRLADGRAGTRDAPIDWAAAGPPAFLARLSATCRENDSRLFAQTADRLRPVVQALRQQFDVMLRLDAEIAHEKAQLAARPDPVLARVGGAEQHLADSVVADRRRREDGLLRAAVAARIDQLAVERARARAACGQLLAQICEEFELAREQSERRTWYFERRAATYMRSLLRRRAKNPAAGPVPEWSAPVAPWTTRPCPWIPAGLNEALSLEGP